MYLALIRVFNDQISMFIMKANLLAWGKFLHLNLVKIYYTLWITKIKILILSFSSFKTCCVAWARPTMQSFPRSMIFEISGNIKWNENEINQKNNSKYIEISIILLFYCDTYKHKYISTKLRNILKSVYEWNFDGKKRINNQMY